MYHWIYCLLLFSLSIASLLFDYKGVKKYYSFMFNMLYWMLALVSSIRYGVGFDTLNYMTAFEYIPPIDQITYIDFLRFRFQPLYTLLNSVCKYCNNSFFFFQIIHSILFWFSFYQALNLFKIKKIYLLLLFYLQFYFNLPMSTFRECLAVSCLLYGMKFLCDKQLVKYYCISFIAFFFHVSAIVMFILPLCYHLFKLKPKMLLSIFLCIPFLVPALLNITNSLLLFTNIDAISSYSERYYHTDALLFSFSLTNYIKNMVLFIFLYYFMREKIKERDIIIYTGFILYLVCDLIAAMQIDMFFRFANYLFLFYYYVVDKFLYSEKFKHSLKVFLFLLILYQPIKIHIDIFSNEYSNLLNPYASFLFGDKKHYDREKSNYVSDYILW